MKKKALIISCFDWYKTRLKPVREILISLGYEVTIFIADFDHINKESIQERYPECTYVKVTNYKKNISIKRIFSHLMFGYTVNKWMKNNSPDFVYCQIPPNNVAKHCQKYKEKHPDVKLVLDLIDLWPESMPIGRFKNSRFANIWRKWRDNCIKVADHVFTECDLYQEELKEVIDIRKTSTLYLYKEQTEDEKKLVRELIEGKKGNDDKKTIKFAYLGSMNNIIDIEGICNVIKQFQNKGYSCELVAIGDGESKGKFEKALNDISCQTCFYGKVFDEMEKIKILTPCDYAFNMMKGNIRVGLTIKSIDYLSYGLPLINNLYGDTWTIIDKEKIGMNINGNFVFSEKKVNSSREHIISLFNKYFSKECFCSQVQEVFSNIGL